jgi:collagen type VII alpha
MRKTLKALALFLVCAYSMRAQISSSGGGNPILSGASTPGSCSNPPGLFYNNSNGNYYGCNNASAYVVFQSSSSGVSAVQGTTRQITATTLSGTVTISLPANLLLPIGTGATASTTSSASLNFPSGVAPTSPNSGDFWNLSGIFQYYDGAATQSLVTLVATQTLTNKTLTTSTIASFVNATHTHANAAGGGQINLTTGVTGLLPHANIASTAVTPGTYTSANITVAADGSITAAANGSGGGGSGCIPSGAAGVVQASNGSGACENTSVTDNGTTVSTTEPFAAPSVATGTSPPSTPTGGTAGGSVMALGTNPSANCVVAGVACVVASSASNLLLLSLNGAALAPFVQGPTTSVANHVATFGGTLGNILLDGGALPVGTITSVTINGTGNQITATGTCSGTATITCTLSIPAAFVLPGTINSMTITTSTGTFTLANSKTFVVNNSITITGTDATTMTLPSTSQTIPGMNQLNAAGTLMGWDLTGSLVGNAFRVPYQAGLTASGAGAEMEDSTTGLYHDFTGGVDSIRITAPQSAVAGIANNDCAKFIKTGSLIQVGTAGAACGAGGGGAAGSTLFSTTGSTTVAGATTTSPTTLIGMATGSQTVPANTFTAGQVLEVVAEGYYTTPATPASLTITLNIGGTIRLTTGAVVQIASITNGAWRLRCMVTTRTTGASGTQIANCIFEGTGATLTPGEAAMFTSSAWTIDTTATEVIDVVATWSTATGSPTLTSTNVAAWIPGAPVTSVFGQTGVVGAVGDIGATGTIIANAVTNSKIANSTIDLTAKVTGLLPQANISLVNLPTPGATCTFTAPATICVATTTATITVPVPVAGQQFCVMNDDNVSTVITLSAIGSSARYENTARTAYGTAGTGTFVSGGAVGDMICIVGRDSTHYLTTTFKGTWVPN